MSTAALPRALFKGLGRYKVLATSLLLVPAAAAIAYAAMESASGRIASAAMAAILVCAAPLACGGLLGFLFGIPRTLTGDRAVAAINGERLLETNTNLEQISDWLTKILVGVGLSQLGQLPALTESVAEFLGAAMGAGEGVVAVAGALLVYFSIVGFLAAYLLMRLVIRNALEEAEKGPPAGPVARLADARDPSAATPVNRADVDALLAFDFDDLGSKTEKIAWTRAKLENDERQTAARAAEQLASALPDDLRVVENAVLMSLYDEWPRSFERALKLGEEYTSRHRSPAKREARLYALLALAHGQAFAHYEGDSTRRAKHQTEALANARRAIELDPAQRAYLQWFVDPDGNDDDLAAVVAASTELATLLK